MDAREWDEKYSEKPLLWSADPNQFVAEEVSRLRPGKALDLACGEGRNAVWMAEQGWDVTGIDFSGVAINRARRSSFLIRSWAQCRQGGEQYSPGGGQ